MKNLYAYIRVSDKNKQDYQVQKKLITEWAACRGINIVKWFTEKQSAAKTGRPNFNLMIKKLKNGKEADGVVIHKIDRSSRNFRDWHEIGLLVDADIDVYFAHENLNMKERGGRLAADIQAVFATDYIRNLKQEIKKGIYHSLNIGLFPFRAPIGYLDNGRRKVKTPDPIMAKHIIMLFRLYTQESLSVIPLVSKMYDEGLRNKNGNKVTKNGIITILRNPFYAGVCRIKGEDYQGIHEPIISMKTYLRAQEILNGKSNAKVTKHDFLFRRMLKCKHCAYSLIGERQKGNVYYRCHTKNCLTKSIREDVIVHYFKVLLKSITLCPAELDELIALVTSFKTDSFGHQKSERNIIKLQLSKTERLLDRLTDAYLNEDIEQDYYHSRKQKFIATQRELLEKEKQISSQNLDFLENLSQFLELVKNPIISYDNGNYQEKRKLVKIFTSNIQIDRRSAYFQTTYSVFAIANRNDLKDGDPSRERTRKKTPTLVFGYPHTSPIVPRPIRGKKLKKLCMILLEDSSKLLTIKPTKIHEITTNNCST